MLASNKNATRSTRLSSTSKTNTSSLSKSSSDQKQGFIGFVFRKLFAWASLFWGKLRSGLWIGSTGNYLFILLGFILLVLPFTFAYLMEFQK